MMQTDSENQTVVAAPKWYGPAFLVVFPLIGAALGWGLTFVIEWIVDLPWFPLQGLFELAAELPDAVLLTGAIALGAVVGLLVGFSAVHDMLTVTVDRNRLDLKRGDYQRTVESGKVASVFVQDKRLVALGRGRQELARVEFDLDSDRMAAALKRYGYTWLPGGDPFKDQYRLWVPQAEGLPTGANPLLKARQHALEKGKGDDAEELRTELAAIDVVVVDKDKKQYWRLSEPS